MIYIDFQTNEQITMWFVIILNYTFERKSKDLLISVIHVCLLGSS